ncbi:hypothetical protein [Mycolicibacterium sp.]|uniref:hypothetical protein n=1 Tax=Mycolicibacterium sp. TaxID=2320850 RepID=UPI003D0C6B91
MPTRRRTRAAVEAARIAAERAANAAHRDYHQRREAALEHTRRTGEPLPPEFQYKPRDYGTRPPPF